MSDQITPLLQHNYTFNLQKIVSTTLNIQQLQLPTVTLTEKFISPARAAVDYTQPGDKLAFEPLSFEFTVDDQMNNYNEVFEWMKMIVNPKTGVRALTVSESVSDGTLIIYAPNGKDIVRKFNFTDCFPTRLGGISFNSTNGGSMSMTCSLTMAFTIMEEDPTR